jgi:hypothetical protein
LTQTILRRSLAFTYTILANLELLELEFRQANCAEWLLEFGKAVRKRLCCRLALAFVQADDALKFRAMVEDWLPDRIARAVGFSTVRRGRTEQSLEIQVRVP